MLIVFDGRAQSVPVWLASSGFVLWEGVKLAGAQYRIPYVYKVILCVWGGGEVLVVHAFRSGHPCPRCGSR